MTNIEAIEHIKELYLWYVDDDPWSEHYLKSKAVIMAKKALEKQIPKKPEIFIDRTSWVECYGCPICGEILERGEGCHNNNCNQKIDWSEEE